MSTQNIKVNFETNSAHDQLSRKKDPNALGTAAPTDDSADTTLSFGTSFGSPLMLAASNVSITRAPLMPLFAGGSTSVAVTLQQTSGTTTTKTLAGVANVNWDLSLSNATIRSDVQADVAGETITYNEMLTILNTVDANGTVTASEFSDLKLIAANLNDGITTSSYVTNITNKLIGGDAANAYWNGGSNTATALGNLAAGTTATQLSELIGKWFLGTDMPAIGNLGLANEHYVTLNAPLYGSSGAPSMNDINQGYLGDCYFLSSVAEVAALEPSTITSMIQSDGNGVYGVRFYINGAADWVTVNSAVPESSNIVYTNNLIFNQTTTDLWADLVEKAYAELNASGVLPRTAGNAYANIAGGWADPITELTNKPVTYYTVDTNTAHQNTLKQTMINALAGNNEVWLGSFNTMYASNGYLTFDSSHAYSVIGYDSKTGDFTMRNPWGTMSGQYWETTFEASMNDFYTDNAYIAVATGTTPVVAPAVTAITETPASADLNAGKTVTLTLTLSAIVSVTGAPTLSLNDGGVATYVSGSGTNSLTFSYTVGAGQNTSALAISAVNTPSGATITNIAGTAANLSLSSLTQAGPQIDTLAPGAPVISHDSVNVNVVTLTGTAEANSTVTVYDNSTKVGTAVTNGSGAWTYQTGALGNGTNAFTTTATDQAGNVGASSAAFTQAISIAPVVSGVAVSGTGISSNVGTIGIGKVVTFTLTMSEATTVTGAPTLSLNDGGTATYAGGSGTTTLTFNYTVLTGQSISSLGITGVNLPNGATIKNGGVAATLSGAVKSFSGLIIDGIAPNAPLISSDSVTGNIVTLNGTAKANTTVTIYDGSNLLGTAAANGAGAWSYRTGNLANGVNAFTTIDTDQGGNVSARSSTFNQTISYSAPTVSSITASGTGITAGKGVIAAGHTITLTVAFTGAVLVTGTPQLALNDGGVATYAGGSGTSSLTFNYTVATGQSTAALAVTGLTMPSGAKFADAYGNTPTTAGILATFTGLQIAAAPLTAPVITNAAVSPTDIATLTGTAAVGTTVNVYDGNTKLGTAVTNNSGAWSYTTARLSASIHTFSATATNTQGNVSAVSSGVIEVGVGNYSMSSTPGVATTLIGAGQSNGFFVYNSSDKVSEVAGGNAGVVAYANYTLPTGVDELVMEGNVTQGTANNDSLDYLFDYSSAASTMIGGSGTDIFYIEGRAGTTAVAGAGVDTFIFQNQMGKDTVTNFQTSKDALQFNKSLFANFTAAMTDAKQVGANTVFTIDSSDTVTLQNITKTNLTANNFHFA